MAVIQFALVHLGICELDILTRDDLENRVEPKEVEALMGSLHLLGNVTNGLAKEVQKNGKPRDLAEERWIFELLVVKPELLSENRDENVERTL